jgi:hypothetical protein
LRSLFVGFETLRPINLKSSNKPRNLGRDYAVAIRRLHDLGIMINGSSVFGLDDDRLIKFCHAHLASLTQYLARSAQTRSASLPTLPF